MTKYIIAMVTMFISVMVTARTKKNIEFTYVDGIPLNIETSDNITYCMRGNIFTYCKDQFEAKNGIASVTIMSINIKSRKTEKIIFSLPVHESLLQWSISAIDFNKDIYAIKSDSIYIYNKTLNKVSIIATYDCDKIKLLNNHRILLLKNYDSHPRTDTIKNKIIVCDYANNSLDCYLRPKFKYIFYTHFVRNFFSLSKNVLAFSQTIPYQIMFYDIGNCGQTDSIIGYLSNSKHTMSIIDSLHNSSASAHDAKRNYYALKPIDDSDVNRIEKILFLNDSTLLVSKRFPHSYFKKRLLDIWEKQHGKWNQVVFDQAYTTEVPDTSNYFVTPKTLPIDFTFSNELISTNNKLVLVNNKVPPKMKMNNKSIRKYYDDYYTKNNPKYFLWVYDWSIKN